MRFSQFHQILRHITQIRNKQVKTIVHLTFVIWRKTWAQITPPNEILCLALSGVSFHYKNSVNTIRNVTRWCHSWEMLALICELCLRQISLNILIVNSHLFYLVKIRVFVWRNFHMPEQPKYCGANFKITIFLINFKVCVIIFRSSVVNFEKWKEKRGRHVSLRNKK